MTASGRRAVLAGRRPRRCSWRASRASGSAAGAPPATRPSVAAARSPRRPTDERPPYDPTLADKTIAFWKAQADRDPEGALERRELAGAYLARQRETGDIADAVRAEDAARRSLDPPPEQRRRAIRLARSLLAQHRFPEALDAARRAAASTPRPAAGRRRPDRAGRLRRGREGPGRVARRGRTT